MPSKEKVSLSQLKVGILALTAMFFVVLLIFLLTGNVKFFVKEVPLHTYVYDAAGIVAGAPVRINGITAGNVKSVALSHSPDPAKAIRVDLEIDQPMMKEIPDDSQAAIAADNLLGSTKFLNITKGKSPKTIEPNGTIPAVNTQQFDQVVQQGYQVLASLQGILQQVQDIVGQVEVGKGTIGKLLVDDSLYRSLQGTVDQLQLLASTLNSTTGSVGKIVHSDELYNQIQTTLGRFDSLMASLQSGEGSAGKFLKDQALYNDLHASVQQVNTLLGNLNAGKGTAGKILKDDQLARQMSQTLTNINTTFDKINAGQGTVGQLMVNSQLYDNLNGSTRDLHELLKDFRANPKKFLHIKLSVF
jgi:phospholipid/cholesterol/gamma-HCH transport system substrate-binding protein